ncbi:unnamed protein product [Cuscuta campestris]|uniref:RRM domain-containing protein n=1 Tax=Cuscuta campestris TaxID=132261 RepID=A0A484KJJ1_9ASTE|nr:unnamed protein product [Cuscuta campestris]
MGMFSHEKELNANNTASSHSNHDEGTSARTRPYTFDEIMLRRKNKTGTAELMDSSAGGAAAFGREKFVRTLDSLESDRSRDVSMASSVSHNSKDSQLLSSRKKDGSDKESKFLKCAEKEHRESETKREAVSTGTSGKNISRHIIDKDSHGERKKVSNSHDGSRKSFGDSNANDPSRKLADRSVKLYEKERKEAHHDKDSSRSRHLYMKRKNDELLNVASVDETENRHSKNHRSTNCYKDNRKEKSEKESTRKHPKEGEERTKDSSAHKKHDSAKLRVFDRPERKDSKRSHYEELRPKRRRSKSREHDKDRPRKSRSHSPKAHKHSSHDSKNHGESYSHPSKDKSGRSNSEYDKNKVSNNGDTSHFKRHSVVTIGLGGYSPRKRKSAAAAKTPSPTKRSPERRVAGWDLPPAAAERNLPAPVASGVLSSAQSVSIKTLGSFGVTTGSLFATKSAMFFQNSYLSPVHAVESIQLTQATRPMRTLYVENLPNSVSDKDVMECINKFLLSSGVNRIQGTKPCISCMIHKEKAQGLLEFLTPEDASAALSFDGRSFSGSILKIRRPKDFIELGTGVAENSQAAVDRISDAVMDSPYKIFVGGISKFISSDMLMEIVKSFGYLKAYHFELNADLNEPCAFLEYVDHSVTAKACAGLNGMKLGGKVLTVVQATPDASLVENVEKPPLYGIPEHAKPLLESPTEVLKLKNVFDPMGLSEQEFEEIMNDVKLECARFGTVKSINFVKECECSSMKEPVEAIGNDAPTESNDDEPSIMEPSNGSEGDKDASKAVTSENHIEDTPAENLVKIGISKPEPESSVVSSGNDCVNPPKNELNIINRIHSMSSAEKLEIKEELSECHKNEENEEAKGSETNFDQIFEPGCVLIEYRRAEASSMAAHCLHGRLFDDRTVTVEYVSLDLYRKKFCL